MTDELATMRDGNVERVISVKHRIHLTKPGKRSIHQNPYSADTRHRELENTECDKMMAEGVIKLANVEWASPTVFAQDKDGSICFCIVCRKKWS